MKQTAVKKAVIPVAGFGARFLPYTKAVPKMMLTIIDKPVLQIIVEEAVQSGIQEILFIVGRHSEIIRDYFTENRELSSALKISSGGKYLSLLDEITGLARYSFIEQTEQKGTAHAVALAEQFACGEPFLLMFGDDLMYNDGETVSSQLISAFEKTGKTVLGCNRVPIEDVPKYASVEFSDSSGRIYYADKITEKPPIEQVKSNLAPLGRYVCAPEVFDYIKKIKPGANGELQITDAFDLLAREGRAVAYEFEGKRYDTGDKLGYLKAVVEYSLRDERFGAAFNDYLKQLYGKED